MKPGLKTDRPFNGALIEIDGTGRVTGLYVCCQHSDQAEVVIRTLDRITKPRAWGWLRRMLGRAG